jgi:hypothetical protein
MTLLEEGLERGSPSVPGISNPVEDMRVLPHTVSKDFFFVPVCGRLWAVVSVSHAEKAHCYLHCNLGKTHCLPQAAGLFGQLPVYCSVLVVRDVDDI